MKVGSAARRKRLALVLGLAAPGAIVLAVAALVGTGAVPEWPAVGIAFLVAMPTVVAWLIYGVLRLATGPLARLIARRRVSLRWKVGAAIVVIAVPFIVVSLINF